MTNLNPACFYYTSNGIDSNGSATPLEHLAIGQAMGVAAKARNITIEPNRTILNYAKLNDQFYAQVGIATGRTIDKTPSEIWVDWKDDGTVHEVVWVNQMTLVPSSMFANQRQSLPGEDAQLIVDYILTHK